VHTIMLTLHDDAVSCVILHVDNLGDLRQLFRTCRHLRSFAGNRRLSLMWFEEHEGRFVAFSHALRLGEYAFARGMIPRMTAEERAHFLRDVLDQGIAELVADLIDPADINEAMGHHGMRPLHYAANGAVAIVLLTVPGVNVNVVDSHDNTPLHRAVFLDREDVVAALLTAHGINVNPKNRMRRTPLHIAAMYDHVTIIDMLRAVPGVLVNEQDFEIKAPLHLVQSPEAVRALLAFPDANPNIQMRWGFTPLHLAIRGMYWDVVEELAATQGVDVNVRDSRGMTPLHIAVMNERIEAVTTLLSAPGIDVSIRNNSGETPMDFAVRLGRTNMIALLSTFSKKVHKNA